MCLHDSATPDARFTIQTFPQTIIMEAADVPSGLSYRQLIDRELLIVNRAITASRERIQFECKTNKTAEEIERDLRVNFTISRKARGPNKYNIEFQKFIKESRSSGVKRSFGALSSDFKEHYKLIRDRVGAEEASDEAIGNANSAESDDEAPIDMANFALPDAVEPSLTRPPQRKRTARKALLSATQRYNLAAKLWQNVITVVNNAWTLGSVTLVVTGHNEENEQLFCCSNDGVNIHLRHILNNPQIKGRIKSGIDLGLELLNLSRRMNQVSPLSTNPANSTRTRDILQSEIALQLRSMFVECINQSTTWQGSVDALPYAKWEQRSKDYRIRVVNWPRKEGETNPFQAPCKITSRAKLDLIMSAIQEANEATRLRFEFVDDDAHDFEPVIYREYPSESPMIE